jgi:hypothetical protein
MRYIRLYTDENGESQAEEVEVALSSQDFAPPVPPFDLSDPMDAQRVIFGSFPVGWTGERHVAPRRQFTFQFTGELEVEVGGGRRHVFGPGSIALLEDTTGAGHITRVVGDVPVTVAFVQLPDSA